MHGGPLGCSKRPCVLLKPGCEPVFTLFHTSAGVLQLDVNSDTVNSELVQEHEKRLEGWSTAELELFFTELVMELEMVSCLSAAAMLDCWWWEGSSSAMGWLPEQPPVSLLSIVPGGCLRAVRAQSKLLGFLVVRALNHQAGPWCLALSLCHKQVRICH